MFFFVYSIKYDKSQLNKKLIYQIYIYICTTKLINMKTVIYKVASNEIVDITTDDVDISTLSSDLDACPLSFFENTEDGKVHLNNYKQLKGLTTI